MQIEIMPIVLALILSILHLFSKLISKHIKNMHNQIISFSSGIFIAIIFLFLFPELIKGINHVNIFFFILMGFAIFHISEKYVYQHIRNKKELMKELAEIHLFGFYIDHFIIGFLLVLTFIAKGSLGFFIFIPFILHTISSSFSLEHCDEKTKLRFSKLILASSTITGAIIASLLKLSQTFFYRFFAFAIGAILYVVVRDMLPRGKSGSLFYFILGIFLSLISIFAINLF